MKIKQSNIESCVIVEPQVFEDTRGYFIESYNGLNLNDKIRRQVNFVQDNESLSKKGTLRGLHYQTGEFAQAKLIRVVKGKILDVAVDLRSNSPTRLKYFSIELSGKNKKQLFIPRGFAHGFLVLEEDTIVSYKCDNYYNKESERGIVYNDPTLNIDWQFPNLDLILSEKDLNLPTLEHAAL